MTYLAAVVLPKEIIRIIKIDSIEEHISDLLKDEEVVEKIKKYISDLLKNESYVIGGEDYNVYIKGKYKPSKEENIILDDNIILAEKLKLLVENGRIDLVVRFFSPEGKPFSCEGLSRYASDYDEHRERFIVSLNKYENNLVVGVQIQF